MASIVWVVYPPVTQTVHWGLFFAAQGDMLVVTFTEGQSVAAAAAAEEEDVVVLPPPAVHAAAAAYAGLEEVSESEVRANQK